MRLFILDKMYMSNSFRRLENLDFIRFIAIFLVVWGHAVQYGLGKEFVHSNFYSPANEWIVSFHMPLFMILSGLFAHKNLSKDIYSIIKQKFLHLFVPALAWTIVSIIIIAIRGKNPFDNISLFVWIFTNYWYITCLILCILTFYIFMKIFKNDMLACIISVVFSMILPYGHNVFFSSMLPFFWSGYFIMKYKNDLNFGWKTIIFCLLSWVFLFKFWSMKDSIYCTPATICQFSPFIFMPYNMFVSFFRLVIGLTASIFIIGVFNKLYLLIKDSKIMKLFSFIGRETLPIYLIHNTAIVILTYIFTLPANTNVYLYNFVYVHIYTFWGLFVSALITYIGIRIPIVRRVFFGK